MFKSRKNKRKNEILFRNRKRGILGNLLSSGISGSENRPQLESMEAFLDDSSNRRVNPRELQNKRVSKWNELDLSAWCGEISISIEELKTIIGLPMDVELDADILCDLDGDQIKFKEPIKNLRFELQLSYLKILVDQDENLKLGFVNFINIAVDSHFTLKESKSPKRVVSDIYIQYLKSKRAQ